MFGFLLSIDIIISDLSMSAENKARQFVKFDTFVQDFWGMYYVKLQVLEQVTN